MTNILFTVEKIGPYHNARFNNICESNRFNLSVLETDISSTRYPWKENLNKKYNVFDICINNNIFRKFQIKSQVSKIFENQTRYCFCIRME